jgi:hypothetical protein
VITSLRRSAQCSFGPVAEGVLVNQRVQVCMRGCFTVKFLGSWKTVRGSLAEDWLAETPFSRESFSIESATGESTSVIVLDVNEVSKAKNFGDEE